MINPPKMLYIHLYCIKPNLYFGIITSVVNPPVELMSASRICEVSGISDIHKMPRISDIHEMPRISEVHDMLRIGEVCDDASRISEVHDMSRICCIVEYIFYVSSYISQAPYIVLGFTYHSRSSLTL